MHRALAIMTPLLLASPAAAQDWSDIVNGSEEERFPAAVSIGAASGTFRFSACTASLITPRILLTAAHCSAEFGIPVEAVAEFGSAFFGNNIDDVPDNFIIGYDDIINHPKYITLSGARLPEFDIGVVVLERDAPVEPVPFNRRALSDADIGKTITSVGFGITSAATQEGSGVKRSAKLTIDALEEQFIVSRSNTNEDRANVCSGDSGGPQYHRVGEGRWEQWSVHSWADGPCTSSSGSTRTDLVADWLIKQIEKVHGTDDYCEAAGFHDNGVCDTWCDLPDPECVEEDLRACNSAGGTSTWTLLLLALAGIRRRAA